MATRRERVFYEMTATDNASRVFRQVEGSARSLGSAYTQVYSAVLLLASSGFVSALVNAAKQGEQSQNRLTASLRATGEQVGITRHELDAMADSMAEATQFDDDAIRNAQGQLVKFGNIHGQVFRDALKVSADLAAFMGTDIPTAAQQIGRALQSPTEGVTLLERHIGKLTEAQEKNIKSLAAQGRAAEAQNAVLQILQERVGGTANLMNTGLTKATSDVAKAWDDMLEAWGRSEKVGGRIQRMLGGIRDIMNDLEGKAPDPFLAFNAALDRGNKAIETLERDLRERRNARRAWGGANVPDDPDFARLQARIDQMKAQRAEIRSQMEGMRGTMAFEDSMIPAPKQGALGGTTGGETAAAKAAADRARVAVEYARSLEMQQEILDEAAALGVKFLQDQDKKREEALKKAAEEMRRVNEAWVESAEVATEISEGMIYTWDAAGKRIQITREEFEALEDSQRRAVEAGHELGFTFSSAFEDAIIEGNKLRDVLSGLAKDIARIVLRKAVTEPMANALAGAVSGMFGGARAEGGPVSAGRAYLVGERGREIFWPDSNGQIIPNGAGGVNVQINMPFSANTPAAVRDAVMASAPMLTEAARRGVMEARARGAG